MLLKILNYLGLYTKKQVIKSQQNLSDKLIFEFDELLEPHGLGIAPGGPKGWQIGKRQHFDFDFEPQQEAPRTLN